MDEWTKTGTETILKFMSLSSKDRRFVHEIVQDVDSTIPRSEIRKRIRSPSRWRDARSFGGSHERERRSRAKFSFTEKSETVIV